MKLIFVTLFLFVQSLAFSAGSSSSVDANKEYLKAEKLIKSYEFEKAEKYYLKALKINDQHIGALEYLGELYYETGRLKEAFELLDRLESAAGKDSEEYLELFEILNS